jgi:beta-lactamase class A
MDERFQTRGRDIEHLARVLGAARRQRKRDRKRRAAADDLAMLVQERRATIAERPPRTGPGVVPRLAD